MNLAEERLKALTAFQKAWYAERQRADVLHDLVMRLGDRLLICAQILGRLAEKRKDRCMSAAVCKRCGRNQEDHAKAGDMVNNPVYRCPERPSFVRAEEFEPDPAPVAVAGVGPDAPAVTNDAGGRQSATPFRCDFLPALALLRVAAVMKEGAAKYGADNWRQIPVADHVNHALVHLLARQAGDRSDDHLGHAACRLLMALELALVAPA